MPYAIVQKSLDQKIDRKLLEEASVHVPSVARADCARLASQLYGIVVSHLERDEAVAFQTALAHYRFPTEVVPQNELPLLMEPRFRRGIRFHPDGFTAIDGMGREDSHPWEEVQFAAGGFTESIRFESESKMEWKRRLGTTRSPITKMVEVTREHKEIREREFRLELFLSCEPYRLQFKAGKETVFRFDEGLLRFHQEDQFTAILQRVATILPPDCQGLGILAASRGETFTYPGVPAFEEEITWQLFQRLRQ